MAQLKLNQQKVQLTLLQAWQLRKRKGNLPTLFIMVPIPKKKIILVAVDQQQMINRKMNLQVQARELRMRRLRLR